MKANASSVWASCCGLLNEVMGTGAVRGQQPGFGAGAGPFRFAPSAGYSTYPPPSSGSPNLLCRACGQGFSVFRRKYICCDCKKSFCSMCTVLQENLRICATCHLLKATCFQRPRLMRLRVKDLRQYLQLRNIPTDTCREKEDLVELVLCHQGIGEVDSNRLQSRTLYSPTLSPTQSASELSTFPVSQEGPLSRSDSSDTTPEADAASTSLLHMDQSEHTPEPSPQTRRRARASLSDISSLGDIEDLSVRQLKEILARNFVNYSGCCEKWELVERVRRLYRETEENRQSMENVSGTITTDGEKVPLTIFDDNLCRICMDAVIDCVLLECGHMVTCTKCGKRMNECPICRQRVQAASPKSANTSPHNPPCRRVLIEVRIAPGSRAVRRHHQDGDPLRPHPVKQGCQEPERREGVEETVGPRPSSPEPRLFRYGDNMGQGKHSGMGGGRKA
uniref:RING-type domain-containing protein n=1 Tax=Knipowitschia caucasica TaxID=637954 RepID=A0AAV2MSG7_KNICA